jgi:hypothetical protein
MSGSKNINSDKVKKQVRKPIQIKVRIIFGALAVTIIAVSIWFSFFRFKNEPFDGQQAYAYLNKQCQFGPRNPGSEGHRKCKTYLINTLETFCDRVVQQNFTYVDKKDTTAVYHVTNIIGSINLKPKRRKRIMICAHWDTRPIADEDPNPENRNKPIIGANDGASGVAIILELARVLQTIYLEIGVDFILFDLEDLGDQNSELSPDSLNPFSIGAEFFAANNTSYRPAYGILLDMVGDRDLEIKKEAFSVANAASIVKKVWNIAREEGKDAFSEQDGEPIFDDHVPFLKRGIPVINIIDFDYPYWHTMEDTPDKCSVESLQIVGDLLLQVILNE